MRTTVFALVLAIFPAFATAATPIKVPVSFIEALSPKDTTSSERFRAEYQNAVQLGLINTTKINLVNAATQSNPNFLSSTQVMKFNPSKKPNKRKKTENG